MNSSQIDGARPNKLGEAAETKPNILSVGADRATRLSSDGYGAMVEPLKDPTYFRSFFLELGALAWPNGFDLSPVAIYRELKERGSLKDERAA